MIDIEKIRQVYEIVVEQKRYEWVSDRHYN